MTPSSTKGSSSTEDGGSNGGAIAGGITAGLLALIALVGGTLVCCVAIGLVVAGGGYAAKTGQLN